MAKRQDEINANNYHADKRKISENRGNIIENNEGGIYTSKNNNSRNHHQKGQFGIGNMKGSLVKVGALLTGLIGAVFFGANLDNINWSSINGNGNNIWNADEINYNNSQKEKEVRVVRGDENAPIAFYNSPSGFIDDLNDTMEKLPDVWNEDIVNFTNIVANQLFSSTQTWLSPGTAVEEFAEQNSLDNEGSEDNPLLQNKLMELGFKTTKIRVLEGEHKDKVGWVSSSVLKTDKRPIE